MDSKKALAIFECVDMFGRASLSDEIGASPCISYDWDAESLHKAISWLFVYHTPRSFADFVDSGEYDEWEY